MFIKKIVAIIVILSLFGCTKKYSPKYDVSVEQVDYYLKTAIADETSIILPILNDIGISYGHNGKEFTGEKIKAPFRNYNTVIIDDCHYYVINITLYNDYPNEKYLDDYSYLTFERTNDGKPETIEVNGRKLIIIPNQYQKVKLISDKEVITYTNNDQFICLWVDDGYEIEYASK